MPFARVNYGGEHNRQNNKRLPLENHGSLIVKEQKIKHGDVVKVHNFG